jgi:diacylglycerol kinase (ATP)
MMPERRSFSLAGRWRSVACALRGIRDMLVCPHNSRIHAAATAAVVLMGVLFQLTLAEWCAVTFAIMSVWMIEAVNTALEYLTDIASPSQHPLAEKAKDAAAAAVLIASLGAAIVGLLVFGPHLLELFRGR